MYKNHVGKITAKAQADGAQVIGMGGFTYLPHHQIQVEVSDQPTVGSLAVEYRTPGASEYVTAQGSPIDLTALNKATALRLDNVYIDALRFTPTGLDADKTYSVFVASNEQ